MLIKMIKFSRKVFIKELVHIQELNSPKER